jgi:hypothetical protein
MRFIPILAALTIGMFATAAVAQNTNTRDPNSAPGVSSTGGKPVPVNPAEVKRDNTKDPGSSTVGSGGKPMPVNPAEIKRENAKPK